MVDDREGEAEKVEDGVEIVIVEDTGRRWDVTKVERDSAMSRLERKAEAVVVAAIELLPGAVAKTVGRSELATL